MNGDIILKPSEPIEVPEMFNSNRTQLLEQAFELDFNFILRDIFDNKEEQGESNLLEYNVTLSSWTESEITFFVAFLNPLEISTVFVPDSV